MMGRLDDRQQPLFYDFCIEDHVPGDHLLRQIAKVLDLSDVRHKLAPYYSVMGRPSLDPELMIRMLLIGYLYGIRSERRLVGEVHLNLAYRWFCGLGLKGEVPERSSFSKTRHGRFRDSDTFRMVFESVLQTCLRAGLVGGETFATDASVIEADARVMRRTEGKEPPDDWNDPANITRPVREYLDQLDKAAGLGALPGESPQAPKSLSLTDPQAALTSKGRSKIAFAYGTNYLIDTKAAIIVDVEPSPARWTAEVAATRTMIERAAKRFGLTPDAIRLALVEKARAAGVVTEPRHPRDQSPEAVAARHARTDRFVAELAAMPVLDPRSPRDSRRVVSCNFLGEAGWNIPAGRSAVVEVYPSREERNGDQHDAYSATAWMRRAALDGSLAAFLNPSLATPERAVAVEGWILGVA